MSMNDGVAKPADACMELSCSGPGHQEIALGQIVACRQQPDLRRRSHEVLNARPAESVISRQLGCPAGRRQCNDEHTHTVQAMKPVTPMKAERRPNQFHGGRSHGGARVHQPPCG